MKSGTKDYANTQQWRMNANKPVLGYIQNGGLLSWVKVLNAGHMAGIYCMMPAIKDIATL